MKSTCRLSRISFRISSSILFIFIFSMSPSWAQWKPTGDKIKTTWGEGLDPDNVHQEYPRPILKRDNWLNMNGLWDFAMTERGAARPSEYTRKILVPFPVESSLSGIMEEVGAGKEVWYRRTFNIKPFWEGERILLHFGAVDWQTEVWINGIKIGSHEGGYDPFSFEVTPFLKEGEQEIVVKVWDPTNEGPQPRGKQVNNPRGIWYTPVTGIWQTVWIEPVPAAYVENLKIYPDIDREVVKVAPFVKHVRYGDIFKVEILADGNIVGEAMAATGQDATVSLPSPHLWSTDDPYLYDMRISVISNGKVIDRVDSYLAMRKISRKKDERGIWRIQLNNENIFQFGTLDQGWWPDGLYTAPSDEALKYDIEQTRKYGFNMIRKHVKVEPARWYMHCDQMGMLVWQDMPSGDRTHSWQNRNYYEGSELMRTPESQRIFRNEWRAIMDFLQPYPSIVTWVPFNEGWGQFSTEYITTFTMDYDPGRLVNAASGGNHFRVGDMLDLHNYPEPEMYLYDAERATVLGEYGGIGLAIEGHLWNTDRNWGYVQYKTSKEATDKYVEYAEKLAKMVSMGFSAAIYTQTTDVEMEVNGLMTYDRKIDKLDMERVRKANRAVIESLPR